MIILDFGSGNTCKNDQYIITQMIDQLAEIDKNRQCIIKWQLFIKAGNNIPLETLRFRFAYRYASKFGFKTTASVFDIESLNFLLKYFGEEIPFIKIANRPDLHWLKRRIPRRTLVIISRSALASPINDFSNEKYLCCISKYPADIKEYEQKHSEENLRKGISDHTINWDLYYKYRPEIYEVHFKLENSTGLDAGEFARIPKQLREIL